MRPFAKKIGLGEIFEAKPWLQLETFYIKGAETQGCPALTLALVSAVNRIPYSSALALN